MGISRRSLVLAPVLLVACGSPPPAQPPQASAPATARGAAEVPVSPSASVAVTPPAVPRQSALHVAMVTNRGEIQVNDVGSTVLVVENPHAYDQFQIYRLESDGLHAEPKLVEGIHEPGNSSSKKPPFAVNGFTGTYPDKLEVSLSFPAERGDDSFGFRRQGEKWVAIKDPRSPAFVKAMYAGGVLTWREISSGKNVYETLADDHLHLAMDGRGALTMSKTGKAAGCEHRLVQHLALQGFSDDSVIGVGQLCTGKEDQPTFGQTFSGPLAIERWKKGEKKSEVVALPGAEKPGEKLWSVEIMVEGDPDDIWISHLPKRDQTQYVGHFDGSSWSDQTPPGAGRELLFHRTPRMGDAAAISLAATSEATFRFEHGAWVKLAGPVLAKETPTWIDTRPNGEVWAEAGHRLFRLPKGASAFEQVLLPEWEGHSMDPNPPIWTTRGEMLINGTVHLASDPDDRSKDVILLVTDQPVAKVFTHLDANP